MAPKNNVNYTKALSNCGVFLITVSNYITAGASHDFYNTLFDFMKV